MIIAIWNGRGLGNGPAVNGLLDLRKREDPDVLFVSETKMEQDKLEWFRWKLEMPHMMVKNCEGRSGGLVLFWKREVNLKVIGFMSRYHIDTEITEPDGFVWRFTGIYGDPRTDGKENTWRLMRTLRHQNNKPWLCGGDFNEILHPWEKEGGVPRPQACMDRFKETLELCELDDLRFVGDAFTWRNNNHDANKYIRERLDRAVATQSWRDRFPGYKVVNGDPRHSDHRPIIINTHGVEKARRSPARGMVPRFEAKWLAEEEYATIVENAWDMEVYGHQKGVMGAVKGILGELVDWNRNKLGDLEKRISKIKKELEVWRKKGTRVDELLDHIDPRVTPAMNELLCKEFNAQEVKEALDSIGDLKAPGIDGQWDEQLVRDNFMEIDADAILATPIRDDFEDFFAWHYDSRDLRQKKEDGVLLSGITMAKYADQELANFPASRAQHKQRLEHAKRQHTQLLSGE
nr:uncharacterized protein LOC127336565 [Lolium perenne]